MSNDVRVEPTPIQRNMLDVATELTQLYFRNKSVDSVDEIGETFVRFHTLVRTLRQGDVSSFKEYLPENIKNIIE
ncbi:hypothetical protein ACJDU8_15700 [Clostridium sp. WILCCON 0269]|uniref:Uncharacterized protein n=1 Tax=Candidatus Clostridium eludens TaxID=3381663 RepID=A0ABW8SMF8_9CLOT